MRWAKVRFVAFLIRWANGPVTAVDLGPVRAWAGEEIWHEAIGDTR